MFFIHNGVFGLLKNSHFNSIKKIPLLHRFRVRPSIRFLDPPPINFVHDHLFFSNNFIVLGYDHLWAERCSLDRLGGRALRLQDRLGGHGTAARTGQGAGAAATLPIIAMCYIYDSCTKLIGKGSKNRILGNYRNYFYKTNQ